MTPVVSVNLTTGKTVETDASLFDSPLFPHENLFVVEVVFWSKRFDSWICLVTGRTGRTWPPASKTREVSTDELDYYAKALTG